MYNSQNLPLSPLKPIKKTLESIIWGLFNSRLGVLVLFFIFLTVLAINIGSASMFLDSLLSDIRIKVFIGIIAVMPILIYIYQYFYYKYYFYDFRVTDGEIRKGVITKAAGFVRYERIQSVYMDQDVWDRLFGLYDVHFETAGQISSAYSHVDGLNRENANKLLVFLNERVKNSKNSSGIDVNNLGTQEKTVTSISNNETMSSETYKMPKSAIYVRVAAMIIFTWSIFIILGISITIAPNRGYKTGIYAGGGFTTYLDQTIIMFIVVLSLVLILNALTILFSYIWYKNFSFKFGKDRGEITSKIISTRVAHVYYDRIQNIYVTQGPLQRMLGLYAIIIQTAGTGYLTLESYPKKEAEEIRDFLLAKAKHYKGGGL